MARNTDIVLVAGDMNAHVGRFSDSEYHPGGSFAVDACHTGNGDRFLQLCTDHNLYISSTAFQHKRSHQVTWRPPNNRTQWTQIGHIVISYRWHTTVQDCQSFWNTPLDSDHALVRATIVLTLPSTVKKSSSKVPAFHLYSQSTKQAYQSELRRQLSLTNTVDEPNGDWNRLHCAMQKASEVACPSVMRRLNGGWISEASVELIEERKLIPLGGEFQSARNTLKRRTTRSLRNDRERWWVARTREMEKVNAIGNSRLLFQPMRKTGPRKTLVSETIAENDGRLIHSQSRRLERWAEHFGEQFSLRGASEELPGSFELTLDAYISALIVDEIRQGLSVMKRNKAPGPADLPPSLLKDGGESLVTALAALFDSIWRSDGVPSDRRLSTVILIYKKSRRTFCGNHRGISLTAVASKLLTCIMLRWLTGPREERIIESQAGCRLDRGCIDNIFTLRQVLERHYAYQWPTMVAFLDLKAAFDSVDHTRLW